MAMQKVRRGVSTGPCRAQSQQLSLQGPRGQFRRARERAANGRAGKIITEEAGEGGGEAGERLNETANALVIPACSGKAEADSHVASSCDGVCQAGWAQRGGNNRHLFIICLSTRDFQRAILIY